MKHIYTFIFLMAGLILSTTSCVKEDDLDSSLPVGSGESRLRMSVEFRPAATLTTRAAAGNSIRHIDDLNILFYNTDGSLARHHFLTEEMFTTSYVTPPETTTDSATPAESTVCRAEGSLPDAVPYGRYRIYAVANMGDMTGDERLLDEERLKNISLPWSSEVVENSAMFGYFNLSDATEIPDEAPLLTINSPALSLTASVRRTVSKVTVAFDGTQLNENVTIYIRQAQIRDIPASCLLGNDNSPSSPDQLIAEGDTILYSVSDTPEEWLMIARGRPSGGGIHSETERALFFFENMQGTGEKHIYDPSGTIMKDNKPYGTYVEVTGYYVNRSDDKASRGPVVYRFMLGKNATDNFDAQRNNHYKLTLRFRNDANDPDWHIEYEPENPEIFTPAQIYISYGFNESVTIPAVLQGVSEGTHLSATIVDNPWYHIGHPYAHVSTENYNGFLSLSPTNAYIVGNYNPNISTEENNYILAQRKADFQAGAAKSFAAERSEAGNSRYSVPVYTRGLLLGNSFSGNNIFVNHTRSATVRLSASANGKVVTQDVKVLQVKRIVNPAGVWRSGDNTSPFRVRLMELDESDVGPSGMEHREFRAPHSDGPWTAHIEHGAEWVRIKSADKAEWGTDDVTGATGSEICFDYRPATTYSSGVRCGVIRVTYHDNECVHYIFVSQGLGTTNLNGTEWQNRNLLYRGKLVDNPLLEGSMFKFGSFNIGFKAENNIKAGYGFDQDCSDKSFDTWVYSTATGISSALRTFADVTINTGGFPATNDSAGTPATAEQWSSLAHLRRYYGVLYGDECTETKTTTEEAYSYLRAGDPKGMQGVFVWDDSRAGNHIFLPIGATGYGHRKAKDDYNIWNDGSGRTTRHVVLKYAKRSMAMQPDVAALMPLYHDIWMHRGAIYWYREASAKLYAHDLNYFTFGFESYYDSAMVYHNYVIVDSDMAFIRCVK